LEVDTILNFRMLKGMVGGLGFWNLLHELLLNSWNLLLALEFCVISYFQYKLNVGRSSYIFLTHIEIKEKNGNRKGETCFFVDYYCRCKIYSETKT
jgi:hypothetical protein